MGNALALALRILTTIPVMSDDVPGPDDARRAIILFPIVGALVGTIAGLFYLLGQHVWPDTGSHMPALLATLAALAMTGGRGASNAARCAEALAGLAGAERSRALVLLRDPHPGPTGMIAAIALVLTRLVVTDALPHNYALQALVVSSALGCWGTAMCITAFPIPKEWNNEDMARGMGGAGMNEFLLVTCVAILCVAAWPVHGLVAFLVAAAVTAPIAQSVSRALGGSLALGQGAGELAALSALILLTI